MKSNTIIILANPPPNIIGDTVLAGELLAWKGGSIWAEGVLPVVGSGVNSGVSIGIVGSLVDCGR